MKNEVESVALHSFSDSSKRGLELLGALLSVRLASRIAKIFKYECGIHYWTDSTVVYCWVRSRPDRLRIELRKSKNYLPPVIGNCPGKENSADFFTRGLSVKNLKKCVAWWNGPHWLPQPEENWPKIEVEGVEEKNFELRRKYEKTIQNQ
ncbi:uncharacterized protein TNCT_127951 [Trichonephila clavata]|uniref:Uncharacterized protein n=1 Tax=Trichonephila clavata TaxID=2740835 RepID=A0A8X6H1J7_TRICU|nr:uncharacterized protein TNCT_127951 [Trichonephila clavata]